MVEVDSTSEVMYEAPPSNGRHADLDDTQRWRVRLENEVDSIEARTGHLEEMATSLKTLKNLCYGLVSIGIVAAGTFVVTTLQAQVRLEHVEQRQEEHIRLGHPETSAALQDIKADVRVLTTEMHTGQDALMRRLDQMERRAEEERQERTRTRR